MDHKELAERIRVVAPGTQLRFALDKIVAANTGALIFLVDDFEKYKDLMQVGFFLNCPFNPNKLYELSKMDGAIVVDESLNKIIAANVQLTPDPSIPSLQTGMRHRTAERMARQTGKMLLAISKRQGTITIFLVRILMSWPLWKFCFQESIRLLERLNNTAKLLHTVLIR